MQYRFAINFKTHSMFDAPAPEKTPRYAPAPEKTPRYAPAPGTASRYVPAPGTTSRYAPVYVYAFPSINMMNSAALTGATPGDRADRGYTWGPR